MDMADKRLIKILENIASLLEIKGENHFKTRAYKNAAEIIREQNIDVKKAVEENTLKDIKGFGKALQEKISDYVLNGEMEYYKNLTSEIPESVLTIRKIANIGPKKAGQLFFEHGVSDIYSLEKLCVDDELRKIKGFSAKSQEMVLNSIQHVKAGKGRLRQEEARKITKFIEQIEFDNSDIVKFEISGDYKKKSETIDSIDIVVMVSEPTIFDSDSVRNEIIEKIRRNEKFADFDIDALKINIHPEEDRSYYLKIHELSASKEYLEKFNNLIETKYGSFGYFTGINSEEDIYSQMKMDFVVPELREKAKFLHKAEKGELPELIKNDDIKGMLHCHSTWSDGRNSIKEMALASKELGCTYFAICDHSQAASYANGLTPDRVKKQHYEIDKLNEENHGIKIIKGIEADILSDGSLDYDEETLAGFEMVVASVHSSFNMSKKDMTTRIICALKSPYTTMLGHVTGRLILVRPAYEVDVKDIIQAAADYGKIIEINANPYRLDLSWENAMYAKEKGVKIAINPDSHKTSTLSDIYYGVDVARKAGLEKKDVVNTLGYEKFMELIAEIRQK